MKAVKIIAVVLAAFFLLVWGIGSYLGVDSLKKCGDVPSGKAGCAPAQAIVAVSGGDTDARADEAIKLYKNGWADIIIFSGAAADKSGPSNAQVMAGRAIEAGVDPNSIIIEGSSETTLENALETSTIFKDENITSAIIVTSAYHQRRALLEFQRKAGSVELRAHPVAEDKQWGPLWWLTPTGWALAVPELVQSLILSVGGVAR